MTPPDRDLALWHSTQINGLIAALKKSSLSQLKTAYDALYECLPGYAKWENAAGHEPAAITAAKLIDALEYAKKIMKEEPA